MFDGDRVEMVVEKFLKVKWGSLPWYGAGASSGGSFVSWLGNEERFHLQAIAVYVSAGLPPSIAINPVHAPCIFVSMTGDVSMASEARITSQMQHLAEFNVTSELLMCTPKRINTVWLKGYRRHWSVPLCDSIVHHFRRNEIISIDGFLAEDPRETFSKWLPILTEAFTEVHAKLSHHDLESARELLNIAWAVHEMTGQHAMEVVYFLTSSPHQLPPDEKTSNDVPDAEKSATRRALSEKRGRGT
jgi:hypothetical protein